MRWIGLLLLIGFVFIFESCSDDDGTLLDTTVTIRFSHSFDGSAVDNTTFNQFNYITEDGDTINITKLRYLISDIILQTAGGGGVAIDGYQLVDVTAGTGFTIEINGDIPQGTYSGLTFTFGFDEDDNVEDAYPDLNVASWNWPDMLGGGYHFMQMEGMHKDQGVDMPYAYHHGTARVSTGVFEQNFFEPQLDGFTLDKNFAEIEIHMNIAEWYKNPNTWDLTTLGINLMPNYDAQKMMQENGATVFSLGDVTQND